MAEVRGCSEGQSEGNGTSFWDDWKSLRSELSTPGYWTCLAENCDQWARETTVCPFWGEFGKQRQAWSNEFYRETAGVLLTRDELPIFFGKGDKRIKSKIHQWTNGLHAKKQLIDVWPSDGPPVPRLNDLVRTRVVCRFLDGVEFIGHKLEKLGKEHGLDVSRCREGRIEGYFAQHLYFKHQVFFRFGGNPQPLTIQCEVQIATELATRIWDASHDIYSDWRDREETREEWQWNPNDQRFIARQLGHMIHLADGLLVQLRDAQTTGRTYVK